MIRSYHVSNNLTVTESDTPGEIWISVKDETLGGICTAITEAEWKDLMSLYFVVAFKPQEEVSNG